MGLVEPAVRAHASPNFAPLRQGQWWVLVDPALMASATRVFAPLPQDGRQERCAQSAIRPQARLGWLIAREIVSDDACTVAAMDIDNQPFIGSEALQAGALNRYELRRYSRAIMPNVYVDKRIDPSLQQRAAAAWLWSQREAVIAGSTASSLLGAKWIPDDAPIELIWQNARAPRGVVTRDDLIFADEFRAVDGLPTTTPERTAFDLGRRGWLNDAVARLDALCAATGFDTNEVLALADEHRHCRGLRQLERALDLCDPGGQSPQETRLRLMLIADDFPRPQTQIPVLGPDGSPRYFLDMGWEDLMVAVEYDGEQHADQLGYDIVRSEYIAGVGWTVIRVAAGHRKPDVLARVNRAWDFAVRRRNPAAFTLR